MIKSSLIFIVGTSLFFALLVSIAGYSPWNALIAMGEGAFGGQQFYNLFATLNRSILVIGMGLSVACSFRLGLLNIGGEGQLVLGGVAAALVALHLSLPPLLLIPLVFLAAALVGGIYALFAGVLQFYGKVPLLISTLLLNYPANFFASYLVTHPFRDVMSGMNQSHRIEKTLRLTYFGDTDLHLGFLGILGLVIVLALFFQYSQFGYETRMMGLNSRFARIGGVLTQKRSYQALFLSGALAGGLGAFAVLGVHYRYIDTMLTTPLYAWTGVMAALLAHASPFGVFLTGLLFSAIQTGGMGMERGTQIPRELSQILQAVIIMMLAAIQKFSFLHREPR